MSSHIEIVKELRKGSRNKLKKFSFGFLVAVIGFEMRGRGSGCHNPSDAS
jgi:hypothetical protein